MSGNNLKYKNKTNDKKYIRKKKEKIFARENTKHKEYKFKYINDYIKCNGLILLFKCKDCKFMEKI